MSKRIVWLAVLLITFVWSMPGFPRAMEDRVGVPVAQNKHWPAGLAEVLNGGGRVYGYLFFPGNRFFFAGDTEAFNQFLNQYARLKDTPLNLVLHPGLGKARRLGGKGEIPFDWKVDVLRRSKYVVIVEVWLGGGVQLSELKVPANVKVGSGSEIAKFVGAHQAKREQTQQKKAEVSPAASEVQAKEKPAKITQTPAKPATFKSKRPLYGKIALTEDGSKILSVVFDESGGTRTGHDVLYADVNFNGRFEEDERFEAEKVKRYGTWLSTSSFAPINFNLPYNKKAKGVPGPCEVTIGYRQYPRPGIAEDISVIAKLRLRESPTVWEYTLSGSAMPSKRPENATVWSMKVAPTIEITTRPDERKKGNLGIGLELSGGENELECRKAGQPVKAHVEIKKPDGTVVHQGDATLDKFTFG